MITSPNFQPPKATTKSGFHLGDALGLMAIYTRPAESHPLGVEIPVVALGNELPRVLVFPIPSRLGTRKRACEAVAS